MSRSSTVRGACSRGGAWSDVHRQRHKELVVLEVREVLVDGTERGDEAVGGGQGAADDLLDVEELPHRLGPGDDLAHHPDQGDHLRTVLQGVGGELFGDVALLEVEPALFISVPQPGAQPHQVADDPVEPHLGDVLGTQQVGFDHPALPSRIHLGVPVRDLLAGELELQVHAGHNRHQHDHGNPPADQQQRADRQEHRDQLGENGGDPVQDPGVGIGEALGPVVEVHRLFVVIAPELQGQEPLVHQVPHDRADFEAHQLLDVPVHAAESAPEQSQRRR